MLKPKHQVNKKIIGIASAIALGISSMIGSGWLFAPYRAAAVAGPASLMSWSIGAIIVLLLGLCFAEIAALYPRRGLSAIIPTLSHNIYFAFPFAIANWLGIVAVIALEADATIEYLINLFPHVRTLLFINNELTFYGDSFSILLVILFTLLNFWGAKTLVKTNNVFAIMKVAVPIFIGVAIIIAAFHPTNFTSHRHHFMPYGVGSILTAILSTGIVVAFNGFQTVISFANEIKQPYRTIPIAIIVSVLFTLCIYILLQVAFIGAMPSKQLSNGWAAIKLYAPIVQIMGLVGLGMLSSVAYFGATVSPIGTASAFTGTATRMFTAMAMNEQMPTYFRKINPVYNISRRALIFNAGLAIIFLLLFKSWSDLAEVLGLLHIISYLPVPIALWVLRGKISRYKYLFRLPLGRWVALMLFLFFSYLFTLAKLTIIYEVTAIFCLFLVVFILVTVISRKKNLVSILKELWTLVLYFIFLVVLSILSPSHQSELNLPLYLVVFVVVMTLSFFIMLRTSRNDVALLTSSVYLYSGQKTDTL